MNILHISSARSWRGGERQVLYLMEGIDQLGITSYVLCPNNSPLFQKCSKLSKLTFGFKNGFLGLIPNLLKLREICKKQKIDVVHGHDSHAHTLIWIAYRTGILKTSSFVTRRLNNVVKDKSINKYNHDGIKKIICVSDAVKATMSPKIIDKSRLVTIHSGIDLSDAKQPKELSTNGSIVVGYVAAFTEEKGHEFFIDSALSLLEKDVRFKFLLVGDGPLRKQIENRVAGHKDKFEFTGFVEDVINQYQRMDVLLHTARSEALGTSILDGMKFGLPIVARDVGGVGEIVDEGKNGYLVSQRDVAQVVDSVLSIVSDSKKYKEMSVAGLHIVKQFEKSDMAKKTAELYRIVQDL